jgi:VAD1 Analog of StAR-related lipid transfer domain
MSYIRPLFNPVGPKQTRCNITEQILTQDFNSFCVAVTATTTPDVPSGSSFQVLTKYCMMWAGGSTTRVLITCSIEWSKSSWLKGAIEKGVNDGQLSYARELISELKKKLEAGPGEIKRRQSTKKKPSKRKREDLKVEAEVPVVEVEKKGMLIMFLDIALKMPDYLGAIFRFLFTTSGLIALLLLMVFYALVRVEVTLKRISDRPVEAFQPGDVPLRQQDYDSLWSWVDTRVGEINRNSKDGQVIWNRLNGEELGDEGIREVEDVIRTTEGKLDALKSVLAKHRGSVK